MSIPENHSSRGGEQLTTHRVFHAVTPGKLNTTNYFFGMGGGMSEEEIARSKEFLMPVIEEDAMATREIEEMLTTIGYFPNELMIKSDVGAVQGRRALQAMMDREAEAAQAAR
jgi:vanillate O-demethylase monooxygenase subunit